MKLRVQVVIEADDDDDHHAPVVHEVPEVAQIDREALSSDTRGVQLAEAQQLLQKVQVVLIDEQVRTSLTEQVACPAVAERAPTRMRIPSSCARCSAPCTCPARAGINALSAADDPHIQPTRRSAARAHHT